MQELELIRRILDGQIEFFRFIVERYERPVVRMIRNVTCDSVSCEDIAQDVFLAAYRKLASFDPARSSFSTWLFTITRNKSINAMKKKRPLLLGQLPDKVSRRDPSYEAAANEMFDRLDKKLQALPSKQRRAFILAEFEGLPYEQIAQIEGTKIGTVKSRINRAKENLKSAIKSFEREI
jgi:RNA polymerase sigma-70 factor (ECF subfamily)